MSSLSRSERIALASIVVLTALAGAADYGEWAPVPRFALATLALAGLAWVVSFATEQVRKDMERDRFFTAEQAQEYGLIDRVLENH